MNPLRAFAAVLAAVRAAVTARAVAFGLALLLGLPQANAHQASDAWLELEPRGSTLQVRWDIALRDLDPVLVLDRDDDAQLRWGEVLARRDDIVRLALDALTLSTPQGACEPGPVRLEIAQREQAAHAVLRFAAACPNPSGTLSVVYRLFEQVDPTHRAIVSVRGDDGSAPTVLRPSPEPTPLAVGGGDGDGEGAVRSFLRFAAEGVGHILGGIDHLAFVVALLVLAVARATAHERSLRDALAELLSVVTLFTLAHSITLALTALRWISLPSRLVESVIAASVVFAGVHAWLAVRGRVGAAGVAPWLVFAFGLIHGFGFGSALGELAIDGRSVMLALLGFNLGVEAGQLLVLALAFPLAWSLRRRRLYRSVLSPALSVAIVLAGGGWLLERAFDVRIGIASASAPAPASYQLHAADDSPAVSAGLAATVHPPRR